MAPLVLALSERARVARRLERDASEDTKALQLWFLVSRRGAVAAHLRKCGFAYRARVKVFETGLKAIIVVFVALQKRDTIIYGRSIEQRHQPGTRFMGIGAAEAGSEGFFRRC